MFAFRFRSLSVDHAPLPGASTTPAVGAPVAATALTKRPPPVARALNSLSAAAKKSTSVASAQVNAPSRFALARLPAAKLYGPPARLDTPPGTVAPNCAATLVFPPPTTL